MPHHKPYVNYLKLGHSVLKRPEVAEYRRRSRTKKAKDFNLF
jgi:hypothetical protein